MTIGYVTGSPPPVVRAAFRAFDEVMDKAAPIEVAATTAAFWHACLDEYGDEFVEILNNRMAAAAALRASEGRTGGAVN